MTGIDLTFVALSRIRKLSDLAFNLIFNFERLQKIGKCGGLKSRLQEEERPKSHAIHVLLSLENRYHHLFLYILVNNVDIHLQF